MNNPLALFQNLRDLYLRYLDSPFDLRYADLVRERRTLLDRDGYLWREPLIEPVPAYPPCGRNFRGMSHDLLDASWGSPAAEEIADFIGCGAFRAELQPYEHQRRAFEQSVVHGRDVVVTTGTGSGKTECFLLPVLTALVRESRTWNAPGTRDPNWDWWNHFTMSGERRSWQPRISQRAHENSNGRPAAIRALLLYPLNALVEDQLIRLREALDSAQARAWLDAHREGNRFYFGRYTGRTPVSGGRSAGNRDRLRADLREAERDARLVTADVEARRFFPAMDGAEMWSRWDMQDTPPDLLITNYSMLNIMLMRGIESGIFDATKQWLEADRSRVFHLIVDELHTYRGTPGTEVAYLLRVLLDRIGLGPDSNQLRIIASSASLDAGDIGKIYLEQFFGRDRDRFYVERGEAQTPDRTAINVVRAHAPAFRDYARSLRVGTNSIGQASVLHHTVGCAPPTPDTTPERLLNEAAEQTRIAEALRAVSVNPNGHGLLPRTAEQLSVSLFGNALLENERPEAVEGVLACLASARSNSGSAPLPLRGHLFFRNVQGIWACTNPQCSEVTGRTEPCPVGVLYYQPTLSCRCGSRVLELLACEACGEIFFGGYRRDDPQNPGAYFLSADHPDLEASPEMALLDREYRNYAVFWPSNRAPLTTRWEQVPTRRHWSSANLSPADGSVTLGGGNGYLYQPRGFRTLYEGGRDFDGVFEWTPRASRPKTDAAPLPMTHHLNLEFWSGERDVCVVNDNAGQLFHFEKLSQGETWVTRDAVDQINAQRQENGLPTVSVRYAAANPDVRALGSIKRTDLLVLGLHTTPPTLNLDPRRVEGRAALYSLGFLLRRAAAVLLDINEWELRVGLRVVCNNQGNVIGQVFLSDALENGAGYCSQFATPAAMERLLHFVSDPTSSLLAPIIAASHADECQTSCHSCLRDYSNLAWHNILDWRMALDLARLALDGNAPVDFATPHWQPLVAAATPPYFRALGWTAITLGGLPAARSDGRGELIVHPLWATAHPRVLQARADAAAAGVTQLQSPKTLFELLRRPF